MKKAFILFFAAILSGFAQNTTNTVSLNVKIANRFSDTITISSGRSFKQKVGINKKGEFQTTLANGKYHVTFLQLLNQLLDLIQ